MLRWQTSRKGLLSYIMKTQLLPAIVLSVLVALTIASEELNHVSEKSTGNRDPPDINGVQLNTNGKRPDNREVATVLKETTLGKQPNSNNPEVTSIRKENTLSGEQPGKQEFSLGKDIGDDISAEYEATLRQIAELTYDPDERFIINGINLLQSLVQKAERVCLDEQICVNTTFTWLDWFTKPWRSLAGDLKKVNVRFYLYTQANKGKAEQLNYELQQSVKDSKFDSAKNTIMILPGFLSKPKDDTWVTDLAHALLDKEDVNVITVSWQSSPFYWRAVVATRLVALVVKAMVELLIKESMELSKLHFIGHSLGAHIAGIAARKLIKGKKQVNRITGLDPAYFGFRNAKDDERLSRGDAKFVDILHTAGGLWLKFLKPFGLSIKIGDNKPVGHMDVYVNGGSDQPGCDFWDMDLAIDALRNLNPLILAQCSHTFSQRVFIASVTADDNFRAHKDDSYDNYLKCQSPKCDKSGNSCAYTGYHASVTPVKDASLSYQVTTSEEEPLTGVHYCFTVSVGKADSTKSWFSWLATQDVIFRGRLTAVVGSGDTAIKLVTAHQVGVTLSTENTTSFLLRGQKISNKPTELTLIWEPYGCIVYSLCNSELPVRKVKLESYDHENSGDYWSAEFVPQFGDKVKLTPDDAVIFNPPTR